MVDLRNADLFDLNSEIFLRQDRRNGLDLDDIQNRSPGGLLNAGHDVILGDRQIPMDQMHIGSNVAGQCSHIDQHAVDIL